MPLLGLPPLRPNFEAAVRDVTAKSPDLRAQAAERLGEANDEQRSRAVVALRVMLGDADPRVRVAALEACGRLGSVDVVEAMSARLEDPDATVREIVVVALAQIGGAAVIKAIRDALHSEHAEIRFQAVRSYVDLCPGDANALRPLIRDEDPMVRINASQALGDSDADEASELLGVCLDDHNPLVRRRAAVALARRGDPRGFRDCVHALQEDELVLDALDALGTLGNREAIEAIAGRTVGLLQPLAIKAAAARALVRLGDPRGVDVLRQVLTAWRSDARSFAVEIVGELGLHPLVPVLARLVRTPRGTDAPTLAKALALLSTTDPDAEAALFELRDQGAETAEIVKNAVADLQNGE